ncbi:MAG: DUF4349 domain-containing protein [Cytophagaceae bacterium]|nr:DUF4349 domain-containing protein [Cytophagaceae bacterium]MDW8456865.1 DUF4349 domain-containing protein [Cytophagaceae bacterium]
MKFIRIIFVSITLLACSDNKYSSNTTESVSSSEASSSSSDEMASVKFVATANNTELKVAAQEKKIIKNASVKFQVQSLKKSNTAILDNIKKYNAYLSSSNEGTNNDVLYTNYQIRVPAENFDVLIDELVKQSIYLDYKNISVEDVTERYVDTEARIRTKKEVEQRYRDILKQARTIEEILSVEAKLGEVREELEAKQALLNLMNHQIRYSTIQLEIYETINTPKKPEYRFWSKLWNAVTDGWSIALDFLILLFRLWPFLLLLAVAIILYRRKRKN